MTEQKLQFVIPARRPVDALKTRLLRSFPLSDEGQTLRRRHFFDTFDWRLYRKNLSLEEEQTDSGRRLVMRDLDSGAVLRWVDNAEMPRFAADLRRGPFRDRLIGLTTMRALLPVAEIRSHSYEFRLRDGEEKTVARIAVELAALNGDTGVRRLPKRLQVLPVRGHPQDAKRIVAFAADELGLPGAETSLLDDALAATGRKPRDYTNKPRVRLKAREPAEKALRKILGKQLDIVEANLAGTRQYVDTEYLHDLRVAVRRTRSLLGQLKTVFTGDQVAPFKREFAWLGSITGPCRDLDVHLLGFDGYLVNLDADLGSALQPVRQFLIQQHAIEQRRLCAWLEAPRVRALLHNWRQFLDAPRTGAPDSERPIKAVADEKIWTLYRKVRKRGRKIDDNAPAADLHRLRIHCKKLRYLLEAFREIYPGKRISPFVGALKSLQNNLGDFHDYHVQAEAMRTIGERMAGERMADPDTFAAIDALTQVLEKKQHAARRDFAAKFAKFDRPRNVRNARRLFGAARK